MATPTDTFSALCRHFSAEPDHDGNVWIDCPECGRSGRRCSFHPERGIHCFRCNYKASLRVFADRVLGGAWVPVASFSIKPKKPKAWQKMAGELAASFTQTPGREAAWRAYKPLPTALLDLHQLGYGVFPNLYFEDGTAEQYGQPDFVKDGTAWWQCRHPRLIIPLHADGQPVGFRCRSLDCGCPRWLSPGGSRLVLYGGACLLPPEARTQNLGYLLGDSSAAYASGRKLILTENPVDALWAMWAWGVLAVATLGVGIWKPGWTRLLAAAAPQSTLVLYDHDLAGNGGGVHRRALEDAWRAKHNRPAPEPAGYKRARELRAAKVKVRLHDWGDAPLGTDLGSYLAGGGGLPSFTPQSLAGTAVPASTQVQPLARLFVEKILGRPWTAADFRSSHMSHAKQLLQTYAYDDLAACLEALRCGLIDCPWDLKYLSQLAKGEPSPLAQWLRLRDTPPPLWKTDEVQKWKELTGRELHADDAPRDSGMPLRPPRLRPESREAATL